MEALGDAPNVSDEQRAEMTTLLATIFADRVFSSVDYDYDSRGRLVQRIVRMGALGEYRRTYEYNDLDEPVAERSESRSRDVRSGELTRRRSLA